MANPAEWPPNSPAKARILGSPNSAAKRGSAARQGGSDSEDEDEETLRLRLARIEAQLKLKRLQKKRKVSEMNDVEVPHTPEKPKPTAAQASVHISPTRIQLGVDKGVTAKDVSLRMPKRLSPEKPVKSFALRRADIRETDKEAFDKRAHLQSMRSRSFNVSLHATDNPFLERTFQKDTNSVAPTTATTSPQRISASCELYDPYSGFKLTNRLIPHMALNKHFAGKNLYDLQSILRTIVPPSYEPPDVPDWVLLGIVASKSEPREVQRQNGIKYLVLTLTDLKYEINVFLFGGAFDKHYKLQIGHVVAILNPTVMKPQDKDSSKWSLNLSTSEDVLLEIGRAKELKFCQSLKRDGKQCSAWVDGRHTEHCEFHVNQNLKKSRSGRMEVAVGQKTFSPKKKVRFSHSAKSDGLLQEGPMKDPSAGYGELAGSIYMVRNALQDNENVSNVQARERTRKQAELREKEREIARQLVSNADGRMGSEYLRKKEDLPPPLPEEGAPLAVKDGTANPFSAEVLRRIGFDPTRRVERVKSVETVTAPTPVQEIRLSPLKKAKIWHKSTCIDEDEELEIIM